MAVKILSEWHNWLEQASDEDKGKYIKFICLWMDFNKFYETQVEEGKHRQKIKKSMVGATSIYDSEKDRILEEFKTIKRAGCEEFREDVKCSKSGKIYEFKQGLDEFDNYLNVVYTIRCNLLHGGKNPQEDKFLIDWAYNTLSNILKKYQDEL